jgi:hypothetical protein
VNDAADIAIEENRIYNGTFGVKTDITNPELVPEMRVRFNTHNLQALYTFSIASAGEARSRQAQRTWPTAGFTSRLALLLTTGEPRW